MSMGSGAAGGGQEGRDLAAAQALILRRVLRAVLYHLAGMCYRFSAACFHTRALSHTQTARTHTRARTSTTYTLALLTSHIMVFTSVSCRVF